MVKRRLILADRSAVRNQDCRNLLGSVEIYRLIQVAGDSGSVFALEMNVLHFRQTQLRNEGIIRFRQPREVRSALKKNLIWPVRCPDLRRNRAVLA